MGWRPSGQHVKETFLDMKDSYLLLVVWPGAPSSVLAPSSDARSP